MLASLANTPTLAADEFAYSPWVLDEAMRRGNTNFRYDPSKLGNMKARYTMGGTDSQNFAKTNMLYDGVPLRDVTNASPRLNGSLYTSKALAYLALVAFYDPETSATIAVEPTNSNNFDPIQTITVKQRLLDHLRHLIKPGNTPIFRGGGHASHTDGSMAVAIALIRHTPAIWEALSAAEKNKLDWIMRAYAAAGNFSQNYDADDDHASGVLRWTVNRKYHNPNLQEGYIGVMIAAYYYFGGADEVNAILADFDFDQWIDIFQSLGFDHAAQGWQWGVAPKSKRFNKQGWTKAEIENTVRRPFRYRAQYPSQFTWPSTEENGYTERFLTNPAKRNSGIEIDYDPFALYFATSMRQFYHKVTNVSSDGFSYLYGSEYDPINPGTRSSPREGEVGMCYEFEAAPTRHSLKYAYEGLMANVFNGALLIAMGDADDGSKADRLVMYERMLVGWEDFLFKAQYGYRSYNGNPGVNGYEGLDFGYDVVERGFNIVKDVWLNYVKPVAEIEAGSSDEDDVPPPPPTDDPVEDDPIDDDPTEDDPIDDDPGEDDPIAPVTRRFEAENATVTNGAITADTNASNGAHVKLLKSGSLASITFDVSLAQAGTTQLTIGYSQSKGKSLQLIVNGSTATIDLPRTDKNAFGTHTITTEMVGGLNVISIQNGKKFLVDYVEIEQ